MLAVDIGFVNPSTEEGSSFFEYDISQAEVSGLRSRSPESLITACSPLRPDSSLVCLSFAPLDQDCLILLRVVVCQLTAVSSEDGEVESIHLDC